MADLGRLLQGDPTLEAADKALVEAESRKERRQYLGMSQIGESCQRKLWYSFRWAFREIFDAVTIKRFHDGHLSEDVQAKRLRMAPGVKLQTRDTKNGNQIRYVDHDGHFSGHCDGIITGIKQAPTKKHIWEAKAVSEKKLAEFRKIKAEVGEKATLKKWNPVYWAQAQEYMGYEGTDRHYLTVSSPGVRDWDSCRTEYDHAAFLQLKTKALRIIKSEEPLDRVSNDPSWFECRYCSYKGICHEGDMPARSCRTCLHSAPVENGQWSCERWAKRLTATEQEAGCPAHKMLPGLVPGVPVDVQEHGITYKMNDGTSWYDGEKNAT